jgi:DNA-binding MarR family transcriptional regulator
MQDFPEPPFQNSSAGFLAAHMARLFTHSLTEALQPLGLAAAQFRVLTELWQEGGLTQRDLLVRLDVEQATLGNTLNRMARDGLISRQPHPNDGRAQLIFLTEHARQLRTPALEAARGVNQQALAGLTENQCSTLLNLMTRVIRTLRQNPRDDGPSAVG